MFLKPTFLALSITAVLAVPAHADEAGKDTLADMKAAIDKQQQEIDRLKEMLDSTANAIEEQALPASQTTIGGYGELHYSDTDSGDSLDFHRFVLFFNHRFSQTTRFYSEVELEHAIAGDGEPGEVELEQAFIEHDVSADVKARFGLFLVPAGILNETHEPNTFYGVERNPVETNIIPTTWREGGASVEWHPAGGWQLDAAVTGGLDVPVTGGSAYLVRKGRSGVAEAAADNLAFTGRVKYTGIPGLELAATLQVQDDVTQGAQDVGATLFSAHGIWHKGPLAVRALYARWDLDGAAPEALGRDEQSGWYVEPSYRLTERLGVFARYSEWDNEAGSATDTVREQWDAGVNVYLHPQVVLKADYSKFDGILDGDAVHLGVGYAF